MHNQLLSLLHSEQNPTLYAKVDDDSKALGFYGAQDWQVLKVFLHIDIIVNANSAKVEDSNPSATLTGQLNDVSQVEKFELTDTQYAERPGASTVATMCTG